jgi:hypothetical protein
VAAAERVGAAPIDHAPDSPTIAAIEQLITAIQGSRQVTDADSSIPVR